MALQAFIAYLRNEKRYSEHTILAYSKDLEQFRVFLVSGFEVDDLLLASHEMIRSWVAELSESGQTPRSISRKISTLRSFYKFLNRTERSKNNPAQHIITPKVRKRNPGFVSVQSMDQLLENIVFPESFEGIRDKLILETFYHTGMRVSELTGLKTVDVDFGLKTLKVLGKRSKERIIPVSDLLLERFRFYLEEREQLFPEFPDPWLFITENGREMSRNAVYQVVHTYLSEVTTIDKKSPHILRHTFATHMLNNGADINAIKEILGHASLAATQVYTHNPLEKLKSIHLKAHPRGDEPS